MSHASLIVALSPADLAAVGGDVEAAVAYQMEPFYENNEIFADGSRWDWYVLGGRFTGHLDPDYSPETDPKNLETCFICNGTGMRNDNLGREQRRQNPSYTCNGYSNSGVPGKSLKHPGYWVKCPKDICQRCDLNESVLVDARQRRRVRLWDEAESKRDSEREFVYGIRPNETREQYLGRRCAAVTAFAFLKDRRWCESGRLGWFGGTARTECEIKAADRGEEFAGKCLYTDPTTGAKIISFGEDDEQSKEKWGQMFWPRFIRNLDPETTLVVVDYHV